MTGTPGSDWSSLALVPGQASSGAYQKKVDTIFPPPTDLYYVRTPVVGRGKERTVRDIPIRLPHEAIAAEIQTDPTILTRSAAKHWPPAYRSHPAVERAIERGEPLPLPIALYLDGVRYSSSVSGRALSVLGIWVHSLLTGKRHLLVCTRVEDFCRCGCRGWCTLHPLLSAISWSLRWLSFGLRPTLRHDSQDGVGDEFLEGLVASFGEELNFTACVAFIKGDWAEASHTLALPSVVSHNYPCPFCDMHGDELHTRYNSMSFPQRVGDYSAWCAAREVQVLVDTEDAAHLAHTTFQTTLRVREQKRHNDLVKPKFKIPKHTQTGTSRPKQTSLNLDLLENITLMGMMWRREYL